MHSSVSHILQFFRHDHLPPHLADVSKPFSDLAHALAEGDNSPRVGPVTTAPGPLNGPEPTVAHRKLLEAKDAAVRAAVSG